MNGLSVLTQPDIAKNKRKPKELVREMQKEASFFAAQTFVEVLQRNVLTGRLSLRPKKTQWALRSGSPMPLVNTRKYIMGFQAVRTEDGAAVLHPNMLLHRWLEYGTRKMKPLPHVRPTMQAFKQDLAMMMGKRIVRNLFW